MSAKTGIFVCLVGPSGAGKDTLLRQVKIKLASEPVFSFPRRSVTRPLSAHEDHLVLAESDYRAGVGAGLFALTWRAHGLGYAVGREVLSELALGQVITCNVSREAVVEAKLTFPRVATLLVTAPPKALAARLAARGRESSADIEERLARNSEFSETFAADFVIDNSGSVDAAAEKLAGILRSLATAN